MTNFAHIFSLKSDQLTPWQVFGWGVRNEEFRWPANYGEASRHHWDEIIFMTLSSYKKRVLAHFENNLDFKATHEFYLDLKSTLIKKKKFLTHFENNLDFKATHEFYLDLKSTLIKKNSFDTFWKQPWFQGNLNFSQRLTREFWKECE